MKTFSTAYQAELDKGLNEPRTFVDLYEFYDSDYVPDPVDGFVPADAIETFASVELTWNGIAYRRQVISRGDIVLNMGEKTNSVSLTFSNIDRYVATWAQTSTIEGMLLCIRCVCPTVTDDSNAMFHGRCDKPGDVDKQEFSLTARQDFGNINQELPPRRFTAEDPEGRTASDLLYEGFRLVALIGSFLKPVSKLSTSFFGRLFGKTKKSNETTQWSSFDLTPYGSVLPMVFGRCQMEGIPVQFADIGYSLIGVWAISEGRIDEIWNVKLQDDRFELATIEYHLGDPGGTGTNATDTSGPIKQGYLSRTAYLVLSMRGSSPDTVDESPTVTQMVRGTQVPLPDTDGVFGTAAWTDNGVYIARFILTDPRLVNIDPAFMEDDINYQTGLHCDEPLIDDTDSQVIPIPTPDLPEAGVGFSRFRSTGLLNPRAILYRYLGDTSIVPETVDGPYEPFDPLDPPVVFTPQRLLRKRYTTNVPITDSMKAVDFLYKVVFPSFKGYLRVNKRGKYEIRSERATDHSYLRAATAVGDTSILIQDVTPWKSGDLLIGRLLLGFNLLTSEVRDVDAAVYSADGNSISLAVSDSGGVIATASGANLTGGSTTVQASGTVTISGTPGAGDTVTVTINGVAVTYTLSAEDTTSTVASLLASWINATGRLRPYIRAFWDVASPTVVTIKCLYGALTVDSAFLKVHAGPIVDPAVAPTVAASSGGSLPAGTWKLAYSNANSIGSTALTPLASIVVTADQKIDVSGLPALPAGITARNFFLSDQADSINLKFFVQRTDAADFSITDFPDGSAAVPPSFNSTGEELMRVAMSFATNSQDVYPAWSPNTTVLLGDTYLPTVPNGHKYEVTTGGVTDATEPVWPTTAGGSTGGPLVITPTNIVGGSFASDIFTKSASDGWGNAGFFSVESIVGDGYIEWTASEGTSNRMVGLSTVDTDQSYASIQFAIYMNAGSVGIYESGASQGAFGSYVANTTVFKIARVGTTLTYYKDGVSQRVVPGITASPLFVDVAVFTLGGTVNPISIPPVGAGAVFMEVGATVLGQAGLTRANIVKDSYKWPKGSTQPSVNRIKFQFRDPTNDFALTPKTVSDKTHYLQVKKWYPKEINTEAVDNLHQALRLANAELAKNREGDWFNSLSTGPQGLVLEEGDVICASDDSGGLINVVTRIEELRIKPNHNVEVNLARKYSTTMFSDDVGAQTITLPSTLRLSVTADSIAHFIDNFAIRDADAFVIGFYVSVSRDLSIEGDWRGWALYADYGDGYGNAPIATGDIPTLVGTADTTLGTVTDSTVFDRVNTLDFTLQYGPPAPFASPFVNATEDELLANPLRNLFLVGNEYVQATDITSNGGQSYTLEGSLLRGRRGTTTTELTHGADERVIYLDGSEVLVPIAPVRLNQEFNYKVVTTNQDVADATAVPFTWTGGTARPLPPTAIRGQRDSDDNLLILWNRRTRFNHGMSGFSDVPLGEEREEYAIQIPDATPVREWRVIGGMGIAALLEGSVPGLFTHITVNTLQTGGGAGDTRARSLQEITQSGNYAEAGLMLGSAGFAGFGFISSSGDWLGGADAKAQADYYAELNSVDGVSFTLKFFVAGAEVYSESADDYVALDSVPIPVRIRLTLSGSEVRFTRAWTGTGSPPEYVSVVAPAFPLKIVAHVNDVTGGAFPAAADIMMSLTPQPATIYTAGQMTADGLTPGDPITVRVAQVSFTVGPGKFAEAII